MREFAKSQNVVIVINVLLRDLLFEIVQNVKRETAMRIVRSPDMVRTIAPQLEIVAPENIHVDSAIRVRLDFVLSSTIGDERPRNVILYSRKW